MQLLRLPDVLRLLPVGRSTIYAFIKNGIFTKPIKVGRRAIAWPKPEIEKILNARISGQSNEEIKILVKQLETNRLKEGKNV